MTCRPTASGDAGGAGALARRKRGCRGRGEDGGVDDVGDRGGAEGGQKVEGRSRTWKWRGRRGRRRKRTCSPEGTSFLSGVKVATGEAGRAGRRSRYLFRRWCWSSWLRGASAAGRGSWAGPRRLLCRQMVACYGRSRGRLSGRESGGDAGWLGGGVQGGENDCKGSLLYYTQNELVRGGGVKVGEKIYEKCERSEKEDGEQQQKKTQKK